MAYGVAEDPGLSPATHLDAVEYPVWRDMLVQVAADNGASVDVINLFKCLPKGRYTSKDEVLRDFGEASRRSAVSNQNPHPERDRSNLGRDAFGDQEG